MTKYQCADGPVSGRDDAVDDHRHTAPEIRWSRNLPGWGKLGGENTDSQRTRRDVETARGLLGHRHKLYRASLSFAAACRLGGGTEQKARGSDGGHAAECQSGAGEAGI